MKKPILYKLSQDTLKKVIRAAFKDGQNWAEIYISWFTPDHKLHEIEIKKSISKILKRCLIKKIK